MLAPLAARYTPSVELYIAYVVPVELLLTLILILSATVVLAVTVAAEAALAKVYTALEVAYADVPLLFTAATRAMYCVLGERLVTEVDVAFDANELVVPGKLAVLLPVIRSKRNDASSLLLSVHAQVIDDVATELVAIDDGAVGADGVVIAIVTDSLTVSSVMLVLLALYVDVAATDTLYGLYPPLVKATELLVILWAKRYPE